MTAQRTDLAVEAAQLRQTGAEGSLPPGVERRERETEGCPVTEIAISTDAGASAVGKPRGRYLTLDLAGLLRREAEAFPRSAWAVARELRGILPALGREEAVLVAGLGNRLVTPDAVGPRAVSYTVVTRHLTRHDPERFAPFRPVAAVETGVLGATGVESGELVAAVVRELRPACLIAVDALAARSVHRLCSTVQLADTGIIPGSGIGNARLALSRETLGLPVIAVGVPTVVDAATLAADLTGQAGEEELGRMLVTPKDIDVLVSDAAKVIGYGVSLALQEGLEIADIDLFLS